MSKRSCTLTLHVTYDDKLTDEDTVAEALNQLLQTAVSTPGVLDHCGEPDVGELYIQGKDL